MYGYENYKTDDKKARKSAHSCVGGGEGRQRLLL
jgi:hypothetical protein